MASRRMFSNQVVHDESFLDMSPEAQVLYFQLSLFADDFGIITSVKHNLRYLGFDKKCIDELVNNQFLLSFEDGKKLVVRHWFVNNVLKSDRITETIHIEILNQLYIDGSKCYTLDENLDNKKMHPAYFDDAKNGGSETIPKCFQDGSKMFPNKERKEINKISFKSGTSKTDVSTHYEDNEIEPDWMKEGVE